MKKIIQHVLRQVRNFKLIALNYGQWNTIKSWELVNRKGEPIPWFTYPALEYLSHLDFGRLNVFEYGSGNSTLWWAKRAKTVTAIEGDQVWYDKINPIIKSKFDSVSYMIMNDKESYVRAATNVFDIFIIDGKYRRECVEHIVSLKSGLMLILDNADWYPKTTRTIQEKLGWVQMDYHGFGPINNYTWTTSIFVNPSRYDELNYMKDLQSCGGIDQHGEDDCQHDY